MKKNLFIITISLLVFSIAPQAWSAPNKVVKAEITNLWIWPTVVMVTLNAASLANPAGCVNTDGKYVLQANDSNIEQIDLMKAGLLAARLAGREVGISISGSSCTINRPAIVSMQL